MSRTRVKICGVMRPSDAAMAARHGADAVGMVLYGGAKRGISADIARQIVVALPPFVTAVGLFVDEPPQNILDVAAEINLRHVQLHGDESPDEVAELSGLTVLKAIRVNGGAISAELAKWKSAIARLKLSNLAGLVLETGGTAEKGGSGVANDWGLLRDLRSRREFEGLPPIIAAGGLTVETVGQVVRDLRPWAVDVSSGVESAVGEKSEEKIAAFIEVTRAADSQPSER